MVKKTEVLKGISFDLELRENCLRWVVIAIPN